MLTDVGKYPITVKITKETVISWPKLLGTSNQNSLLFPTFTKFRICFKLKFII